MVKCEVKRMNEDNKITYLNDFNDTKDLADLKLNLLKEFFLKFFEKNTEIINEPPNIICRFEFNEISQNDGKSFIKKFVECNALFKYRMIENPFTNQFISIGVTGFPTVSNYQVHNGLFKVFLKVDLIGIYLYVLHLEKLFSFESKKLQRFLEGLIDYYQSWNYKVTRI